MSTKAKIFIAILVCATFMYGLMVGHYKFFPFYQIIDFRNKIFDLSGIEYGPVDETIQTTEPVEVLETSLHRLLLKKIHLSQDEEIVRGGAMANIDYQVFINTNANSQDRELILVYDLENYSRYKSDSLKVPMNYETLLSSPLIEMDGFDLFRFRVNGLYLDKNSDESYTLFASHHFYEEDKNCISFNISRTTISFREKKLIQESDWKNIFKAKPCVYPDENVGYENPFPGHMASGKIVEYDENTLLVSVGSFSTDPDLYDSLPMDDTSFFGKLLLIDKMTGESKIFAKGIRNSQGLLIDNNGTIWATDHGPRGGDELNIIKENGNYGWPLETYGINYGMKKWPFSTSQGRHDVYDKPAFVWIPSIATTNLIQIGGNKYSLWQNDLLIGSLSGKRLERVRVEEGNQAIYSETIPVEERIRDMLLLPDEKIVLLTDEGSLFILDDGGPVYEDIGPELQVRMAGLDLLDQLVEDIDLDELEKGALKAESIYAQHCSSCHFLTTTHDIGPHLSGLFQREVGGLPDYNYSYELETSTERWTPGVLKSFLLEPENQFPNTSMKQIPLSSTEADSIIAFLERDKQ